MKREFHTRSLNKPGTDASPSSKLSMKKGNITSTTSGLLIENLRSASNLIKFNCREGAACFSFSTWKWQSERCLFIGTSMH
ncbi:phosphatidylinositol 4-kinase alpha 1 [Nicotiana attenuata]|uniref:Phosphatidylinositol 4-kinase alpha 1 n=1 Tax=Nicotiana attenuata TaxID=49451 RepID=A0A1J6IP56_NICAT|nr:phosphatidylinositol 4-kinase alpha 1 [Nicotiana attenuata]